MDDAAATYSRRQHPSTARLPRKTPTPSSRSSVLRLKIKKRVVGAGKMPTTGRRRLKAGGVSGDQTPEARAVKRCRPAHWSPVHSANPADVWLPPPGVRSLMDKVSITDVTANTLTVTVRECTTGEGFFRRPETTEDSPATGTGHSPAVTDLT